MVLPLALTLATLVATTQGRTYSSSEEALRGAKDAAQRAERGQECVDSLWKKNQDLVAKGNAAIDEARRLVKEKKSSIKELSQGFYCSKCGNTATQIEKSGKSFQQHLSDVSGRSIPAPASRIKAKVEEYDRKIEAAREKVNRLRDDNEKLKVQHATCKEQRNAARDEEARAKALAELLAVQESQREAAEAARKLYEARVAEQRAKAEAYQKAFEKLLAAAAQRYEASIVSRKLPPDEAVNARVELRRKAQALRASATSMGQDLAKGDDSSGLSPEDQAERDWALWAANFRAAGTSSTLRSRLPDQTMPDTIASPPREEVTRHTRSISEGLSSALEKLPKFRAPDLSVLKPRPPAKDSPEARFYERAIKMFDGPMFVHPDHGTPGSDDHYNTIDYRSLLFYVSNGGPLTDVKAILLGGKTHIENTLDDAIKTLGIEVKE